MVLEIEKRFPKDILSQQNSNIGRSSILHSHNVFICVDDNILDEGKMHYVKDQASFLETNLPFINNNERIEYMSSG